MARKHAHRAQIVTSFVRIPEELADGKVRCLGCSAVVTLTPNGHIRRHKSPAGEDCAYTSTSYAEPVHLDALPPVVVPPQRSGGTRSQIKRRAPKARPKAADVEQDARLAPRNNECVDCGRWLPGERTVCGKCARIRNETKGRGA